MQDAGWGWGPASNGTTLFTGSARSGGCRGGERSYLPDDSGAVWGQRCQRGQVVAALAGHRQCRGQADGWAAAAAAERRARVAVGADRRKAGPDPGLRRGRLLRAVVAELAGRGTPARYGAVWRFFAREGISFKKSWHASEQSLPRRRPGIASTSPAGGRGGRCIRAGLIRGAWCSSTKLGPRPT
jgi:hypothetical protein